MAQRKQAAVMFTDVVGFTTIMEQSEDTAMQILSCKMKIVHEAVAAHGGKVIKEMGDGTMSVFHQAPEAVLSAMVIQENLEKENFRIRIGIHCGSVLFESGDIFGDTVNVASRLEKKAPGGGTLVSSEVLAKFTGNKRPGTVNLGLTRLKGLGRLLQIHSLNPDGVLPVKSKEFLPLKSTGPLVLAVFPLENKGEKGDEFYAYGITADLLSDLSKTGLISTVPATSLVRALNTGESHREIARRFHSSAWVHGSIERTGSAIKLSLSLIEMESGRTVWMDTWVEEIDELPAIKGKLADGILRALGEDPCKFPEVTDVAVESVSVYEKYLQALHFWETKKNMQHILEARKLLNSVIELEPEMIPALVLLGTTYRDLGDFPTALKLYERSQKTATAKNNPSDLFSITRATGIAHWMRGDPISAGKAYDESMSVVKQLNNRIFEASLLNNIALLDCDQNLFPESLQRLQESLDISSELGSLTGQAHALCNLGLVYSKSGSEKKAIEFYEKSLVIVRQLKDPVGEANLLTNLGVIYTDRGNMEKAYSTELESYKLSELLNDKRSMCRSLNNMCSNMLALGQNDKAEELFTDSMQLAKAIGDRSIEGILITNLVIIKLQKQDIPSAAENCTAAMKLSREIDDSEGIVENNRYMAEICLQQNKPAEALAILTGTSNLCSRKTLSRYREAVETDIALCMTANGTPAGDVVKQFKKAQGNETKDVNSLPGIYWKWFIICRYIAEEKSDLSPAAKSEYLKNATTWKEAAKSRLLRSATGIESEKFRDSFLNNIPVHKEILS